MLSVCYIPLLVLCALSLHNEGKMATHGFKAVSFSLSLLLFLVSPLDEKNIRRLGQRNLSRDTQEINAPLDLFNTNPSLSDYPALIMITFLYSPSVEMFPHKQNCH